MTSVLLVGNPAARSGRGAAVIGRTRAALARRGVDLRERTTAPGGATVAIVADALREARPDALVVAGGDGTLNEVARAVLDLADPVPIGLVPTGTANDAARSLGIPLTSIEAALDVALGDHGVALDVGLARALDADGATTARVHFLDAIGWGLQPAILAERNRDRERLADRPLLRRLAGDKVLFMGAAAKRVAASLREPIAFDAEVVVDGRAHRWTRLADLLVSGTPIYAGDWVVDRRALPDDGRFEVVPMRAGADALGKALRDLRWLPVWQEHLDRVGVSPSRGVSGAELSIAPSRPLRAQVDGDLWVEARRFSVTVLARRLPVRAPAGFEPPWRVR